MDKVKLIKSETKELLDKIVDKYELDVSDDEGAFHVTIKKLLEVILYKKVGESVEILVNVNDYREKQKERLEELAERYVQKTKDLRSASYIRGLSSYERKLIHEHVTEQHPDLASYSTGEGKDRRLVIDLKENAKEE